jgi:hypothetical protein
VQTWPLADRHLAPHAPHARLLVSPLSTSPPSPLGMRRVYCLSTVCPNRRKASAFANLNVRAELVFFFFLSQYVDGGGPESTHATSARSPAAIISLAQPDCRVCIFPTPSASAHPVGLTFLPSFATIQSNWTQSGSRSCLPSHFKPSASRNRSVSTPTPCRASQPTNQTLSRPTQF